MPIELSYGQKGEHALVQARGPVAPSPWLLECPGDMEMLFPSGPLSRVLMFSRERDIGKLIRRLFPVEIEFSATVARKSLADDEAFYRLLPSTGGRPSKEYLLTRRQAIKVILRSEAPHAVALQDELIEVLLAVQHQRQVQAHMQEQLQLQAAHEELETDYRVLRQDRERDRKEQFRERDDHRLAGDHLRQQLAEQQEYYEDQLGDQRRRFADFQHQHRQLRREHNDLWGYVRALQAERQAEKRQNAPTAGPAPAPAAASRPQPAAPPMQQPVHAVQAQAPLAPSPPAPAAPQNGVVRRVLFSLMDRVKKEMDAAQK